VSATAGHPKYDHDHYRRRDWHEKLLAVLEEIRDDKVTPNAIKDDLIVEMMQSFYYEDWYGCDECPTRGTPPEERKANFPYRLEVAGVGDSDGLIATYDCRTCGHIYQQWYSKDFHRLSFG
jgi:hypothetical protein